MPQLREAHKGAANPEPFQPYAAYLAWVEENERIAIYVSEFIDGVHNAESLLSEMKSGECDPAKMLGYLITQVDDSIIVGSSIFDENEEERKTALAAIEYLKQSSFPKGYDYLAYIYQYGMPELDITADLEESHKWRLKAAEGGDLRAQYQLGTTKIETGSDDAIADGLKLLWTAAKGLYPPALACWKTTFNSIDEPALLSYPNVEREQIDEMAESFGLLSRLMECAPNDQQKYLKGVLIGQMAAWEGNGMIFYPASVLTALKKWGEEQESPYAIENLMKSLYGLAHLDCDPPIMKSPTATPPNAPNATPA